MPCSHCSNYGIHSNHLCGFLLAPQGDMCCDSQYLLIVARRALAYLSQHLRYLWAAEGWAALLMDKPLRNYPAGKRWRFAVLRESSKMTCNTTSEGAGCPLRGYSS